MFRRRFAVLACLLCHSPPHSSAPPTSAPNNLLPRRRGTGRPKKSFLPSPAAKPAGTVSTMQNISAAHPPQKVTELTFFLRVSGYDAGGSYIFKNPDHIFYNF